MMTSQNIEVADAKGSHLMNELFVVHLDVKRSY